MRKSWPFLSWLVGQFEFENECSLPDVWKKAALCQEPSGSFAYYCAYFLTIISLNKICLSSKSLCGAPILKINLVSRDRFAKVDFSDCGPYNRGDVTSVSPSKCNKFLCCILNGAVNSAAWIFQSTPLPLCMYYVLLQVTSQSGNVYNIFSFCLSDHDQSKLF